MIGKLQLLLEPIFSIISLIEVFPNKLFNASSSIADPSEFLDQSTYTADDGVINFEFANPVFTQGATVRILITYEL